MNLLISISVPLGAWLDTSAAHAPKWTWLGTYGIALISIGLFWLLFVFRLLILSPYREYKKESEIRLRIQAENESLMDVKSAQSRERKERALNEACDAIRRGAASILAIQMAKADELQSNEELVWLCDQLVSYGKQHPFASVLDLEPAANYLFIMQAIRRSGAVIRYSEELPGFLLYVKRPSPTHDKEEPPHLRA